MILLPLFDPKADSPLPDEQLRALKDRYQDSDIDLIAHQAMEETLGIRPGMVKSLDGGMNAMDHIVILARAEYGGEAREFVVRANTGAIPEPHIAIEAKLYEQWRAHGISMPRVYGIGMRTLERPYDYMVMGKVGDFDLETYRKGGGDRVPAARAAGAFLAGLHHIELPGFGPVSLDTGGTQVEGAYGTWTEAIREGVPGTIEYLEREGIIDARMSDAIASLFERYAHLLGIASGVALHGDYHPANILMSARDSSIAGAVDLSQAKVGDPAFDIAFYSTYDDDTLEEFIRGYEEHIPSGADFRERLALYRLRILMSKAKLRKRFGYDERIPAAVAGIEDAVRTLG